MSIRLSKACKELNVGMTTAVEFFAKKGHKIVVDPNLKLTDDMHLLLAKEFNKDMALRIESERISQERHHKDKAETVALEGYNQPKPAPKPVETIQVTISEDQLPHFKSVGHIDLSAKEKPVEKKPETPKPAPEVEKPVVVEPTKPIVETIVEKVEVAKPVEQKVVVEVEKPAPKKEVETPKVESQPKVEVVAPKVEVEKPIHKAEVVAKEAKAVEVVEKQKVIVEPKAETVQPIKEKNIVPEVEDDKSEATGSIETKDNDHEEDKVFSLSRPTLDKAPVVIGTINLDLLNQSTRPKPKSKEQKRREREDKGRVIADTKEPLVVGEKKILRTAAEVANSPSVGQPKKKRERFSNQKVDINKVPQPNGPTQGFASPKKVTPGTTGGNGGNAGGARPNHPNSNNRPVGGGPKRPVKTVVNEVDVQKQIKETLARLSGANKKGKGSKYRRDKREGVSSRQQEQAQREREGESVLKLTEFVTASELAVMMDVTVNQVIATCMNIGLMVSINQRLDAETINIVAEEFGFTTEYVSADVIEAIGEEEVDSEEDLMPRAPIVTVMGHVDHGKTSLLDHIRKANVIAGEAGGITQHIGAYSVELENGKHITFLDTPGHEAFTAMRARGAQATDIAIIVVAADDSVMPQTREAINHAQAAGVPIVIAINKMDKPGANPNKIKEDLSHMNILVEEWGGKVQCQEISAKKGTGVDLLLEKVLLEAEMLDLKANPKKNAVGIVIEASLDKGKGYVATLLVGSGTMHVGDVILAGSYSGRVKAMNNERGRPIESAGPATPVMVLGLTGAPQAGDKFNVMDDEREAREIATKRLQLQREQGIRTQKHITLDEIGRRLAIGDFK